MKCKNFKLKPKNKIARAFISLDTCQHLKKVTGAHFTFKLINKVTNCPFINICKYYKKEV